MRRALTRVAVLGSVAGAAACGGESARANEPLPKLPITGGPEAVVLRVPRSGGAVRSYRWPALDSAIWTGTDRVPAIARIMAFDEGGGLVAFAAADGRAGRIDLRTGRVQFSKAVLSHAASIDGWSLYGIGAEGRLARNTPTAEWNGPKPSADGASGPIDTVLALPGGFVALVTHDSTTTRLVRYHPPASAPAGSLEMPRAEGLVRTRSGDRLYARTARGVIGVDARAWKIASGPRTSRTPTALAVTPSGDRLLVLEADGRTLRVWERYAERFSATVDLPAAATDLRMDTYGRYVLARIAGDSVIVVSVPLARVVSTLASEWRSDLPAVTIDGSVLTVRRSDVLAIDPATGARRARIDNGALDQWLLVSWDGFRPRDSTLDAPVTFATTSPADSAAQAEAVDSTLSARIAAMTKAQLDSVSRATPPPTPPPAAAPPTKTAVTPPPRARAADTAHTFTVSFASVESERTARLLAQRIRVDGKHPRVVANTSGNGVTIYRVVLGPFATRAAAEAAGKSSGVAYWVFAGMP